MARGVNKVILIGNLGADPELKYTPSGTPVCTFRLATSESFKDREGNMQERTEWHRIVAWAKLGEIAAQYLSKGRQVFIEGSIRTRSWEDQSGERKYMTEIVARDIQFLGAGGQGGHGGGGGYGGGSQGGGGGNDFGGPPSTDDDIPF